METELVKETALRSPKLYQIAISTILELSYAKNIGIRRAISSGNPDELDVTWQPQINLCFFQTYK